MELIKLSEAYTLTDVTDVWETNGNVTKETNGMLHLNLNTVGKDVNEGYVGANYLQVSAEGKVQANYNFNGDYNAEYVDYCENLVKQVFEIINGSTVE